MDIRVDIQGGACLLLAVLCLAVPLDWLLAASLAGAAHEAGHILTVFLLGGTIRSLSVGPGGAVLDASPLTPGKQLTAILAGPAGSLLLLLLRQAYPMLALCGLLQGLFNLIPVYPLDGGRALRLAAEYLFGEAAAEKISTAVFWLVMLGVLLLGFWGTCREELGPAPMLLSLILCLTAVKIKSSCKEGNQRVQ